MDWKFASVPDNIAAAEMAASPLLVPLILLELIAATLKTYPKAGYSISLK
jgi:hypothetical protein